MPYVARSGVRTLLRLSVLLAVFVPAAALPAQSDLIEQLLTPAPPDFGGLFGAETAELRLRHLSATQVIGDYRFLGTTNAIQAQVVDGELRGSCMIARQRRELRARFDGDVLRATIGEQAIDFGRRTELSGLTPEPLRKAFAPLRDREPAYDPNREWTIVVYMAADNDLEEYALSDLLEMEAALPEQGVELLVLVDRAQGQAETTPDWTDTRLLRIRRDADPTSLLSETLALPGELDMGDPDVLGELLGGAMQAFPARHNMLVMWDHGGGWASQCVDIDAPGVDGHTDLSMVEVRQGIEIGLRQANVDSLDIVAFDQCLMAQLETANELAGVAEVMVASENLVPAYGMPYSAILPLFAQPHLGPRRMAARMVEEFNRFFTKLGGPGSPNHHRLWVANTTFSALDVTEAGQATQALDRLLEALEPELDAQWMTVTRCLYYAEGYSGRDDILAGEHAGASIDLCDALTRMRSNLSPFPAELEYRSLMQALDRFVVVSQTGDRRRRSNGVSIYAPVTAKQWNADYLATAFAGRSRWPGFLDRLHSLAVAAHKTPTIDNFSISAATGPDQQTIRPLNGSFLHFDVDGNELCWLRRFIVRRETDGLRVLRSELVVDPDFVLRRKDAAAMEIDWVMPQFENGRNALRTELTGMQLSVSNGRETALATTYRLKVDSAAPVVVNGVYYPTETDAVGQPVMLEFDSFLWTPTIQGLGPGVGYIVPAANSSFAFQSEVLTPNGTEMRLSPKIEYRGGLRLALTVDEPGDHLILLRAATMDLESAEAVQEYSVETNPKLAELTADWSKFEPEDLVGTFRQLVYTQDLSTDPTGMVCQVTADPTQPNVYHVATNWAIEGRMQLARQLWILDLTGTPSLRILELDADDRVTAIYYGPALLRKNDQELVLHTKVLNYGGILWLWAKQPSDSK